jgi:hypothetical protein
LLLATTGCAGPTPETIEVGEPERAVAEARQLIERRLNDPQRNQSRHDRELDSKNAPGLTSIRYQPERRYHFVEVQDDHVDIPLFLAPDFGIGARIWRAGVTPCAGDGPTRYKDVFWYRVDNDRPKSSTNCY